MTDEAPDPLAALIARSVGAVARDVRLESLRRDAEVSLERVRYRDEAGAERTLVLKRLPQERSLEAQLLPFLARRTTHVPEVRSRGIPPRHVPAKPWLLLEDLTDAPSACPGGARAIVAALLAVRRAVERDGPALRALGVPTLSFELPERLRSRPTVLAHGDLRCENVRAAARGVVIDEWRWAHLGCGLLDVVRLRAELGDDVVTAYVELSGEAVEDADLGAAEELERMFSERVRD